MNVGLVVVTDGRLDYLARTIKSLELHVDRAFCDRLIVNDSGSPVYDKYLHEHYPDYRIISHPFRHGLAAAVQTAWSNVEGDWIVHLEEDFLFREVVDLEPLIRVLIMNPTLAQMALKRQPWSPEEYQAGGIVELHPEDYTEVLQGSHVFTVHKRLFTLNPCVIPRAIIEKGWPATNEAGFSDRLIGEGYYFAYWGRKLAAPLVQHIGIDRSPSWAL